MLSLTICPFNDCILPVVPGKDKCKNHKHRKLCLMENCRNQVYARGLCVRHGGKRDCLVPSCMRNVRVGDYCNQHANDSMKRKNCTEHGCTKVAHNRRKCVRHGGGRPCLVAGCTTHARTGGTCHRHSKIPTMEGATTKPLMDIIDQVMFADSFDDSFADSSLLQPTTSILDFNQFDIDVIFNL